MSKTCVLQEERTRTVNEQQMSETIDPISPTHTLWPFLPKSSSIKQNMEKVSFPPNLLLRSASLDRIRQFPSYLCRQGSSGQLFTWIYNSRTAFTQALSFTQEQLRRLLFVLSVYLIIGILAAQLFASLFVLATISMNLPTGFIFLFACVVVTTLVSFKTIQHDDKMEKHH